MPSLTYLAAALVFASAVVATPVQIDKRDKFSVPQVPHGTYFKNGPEQKIRTLLKYGKEVPQSLLDAASNRAQQEGVVSADSSTGSEPANPSDNYDSSYLSPVTVGTTSLNLDFDTGSAFVAGSSHPFNPAPSCQVTRTIRLTQVR